MTAEIVDLAEHRKRIERRKAYEQFKTFVESRRPSAALFVGFFMYDEASELPPDVWGDHDDN